MNISLDPNPTITTFVSVGLYVTLSYVLTLKTKSKIEARRAFLNLDIHPLAGPRLNLEQSSVWTDLT